LDQTDSFPEAIGATMFPDCGIVNRFFAIDSEKSSQ